MPWLLFSYLAVRGDDEVPLAIPSHVAVMCGLTFTRILFSPPPVHVLPHTYNGSTDGPAEVPRILEQRGGITC